MTTFTGPYTVTLWDAETGEHDSRTYADYGKALGIAEKFAGHWALSAVAVTDANGHTVAEYES